MTVELNFGCCQNWTTLTSLRPGFSTRKRDVYLCRDGWTKLWLLPKLNNTHVPSSRIFNPEEGRLGSTKNFGKKFFGYLTKNCLTKCFWFCRIQFCARRTAFEPKKTLAWSWDKLRRLGLRGISPTLKITATNPEILMPCSLFGIPKTSGAFNGGGEPRGHVPPVKSRGEKKPTLPPLIIFFEIFSKKVSKGGPLEIFYDPSFHTELDAPLPKTSFSNFRSSRSRTTTQK